MLTCQNEAKITAVLLSSQGSGGRGEISPQRRGNRVIVSTILELIISCYFITYTLYEDALIVRTVYLSYSFHLNGR
jgi:hypothetical protein